MRQLILYGFALLTCIACSTDKKKIRITGTFDNLKTSEFYLLSPDVWNKYDTLRVERGQFTLEQPLENPGLVWLRYPNQSQTMLIVEPGSKVKIKGDAKSLKNVRVEGTPANELFTEFRLGTNRLSASEKRKTGADFIRTNPESMAAVAVWYDLFCDLLPTTSTREQTELLRLLQKNQPDNRMLQVLDAKLRARLQVSAGYRLPTFTTPTLNGDTLHSKDLKGYGVLVYFWGSWNDNSISNFYRLRDTLTSRKKQLKVINLAIDADIERCRKIAERDSLHGYTVCDGGAWNGPMARLFAPQYIPGNVLTDTTGKIIARDLEIKALLEEISKRFPLK